MGGCEDPIIGWSKVKMPPNHLVAVQHNTESEKMQRLRFIELPVSGECMKSDQWFLKLKCH